MFDIVKLESGVTIVLENIPFVRSISFGIFVRNGSRNETQELNGISHFIEHMLFKGTENRKAKDIADEMDAVGGQLNAYTTKEYTCYYARTLDTHFDVTLDVLSDMFFNSLFDDSEIQKEKNVILEEINMYEDAPEDLVYDRLQFQIWRNNSLGLPILGKEETILSFDNKTFKDYYKKNYHPNNTVIAVAGNFDSEDIVKKIEKYFGGFIPDEDYAPNIQKAGFNQSFVKTEKDIEQVHMCLAFPGIQMGTDDSYVLTLLNTIFGGGMSSRLFQRIREEHGLCYSVYSYNSNYCDSGIFSIYAGLNPNQMEETLKLIIEEIRALETNRITEDTLRKTKEQIKSNLILGLENSSNRMSSIGRSQLLLDRVLTTDQVIQKVDDIALEDVYRLVGSIFDFNMASLSIVGKVSGFDVEALLKNAAG